ncbi:MAG TPA: phosphatase PAP2 family protein [Clostridiaceae bacterium]|nr:phosphatase PAP2 family protein [Clostridiaceae bacterium]
MTVLYYLQSIRSAKLDRFMKAVTKLGNAGAVWIALAFTLLLFKSTQKGGQSLLLALTISAIIGNVILKNLVNRDRPCWRDQTIALLIPMPQDYSFPSGHTYSSFTAAFCILPFVPLPLFWAALLLASAIGLSRLYLFVHYLSDVLVGAACGILTGTLVAGLFL